jgi:hypothetical protein
VCDQGLKRDRVAEDRKDVQEYYALNKWISKLLGKQTDMVHLLREVGMSLQETLQVISVRHGYWGEEEGSMLIFEHYDLRNAGS